MEYAACQLPYKSTKQKSKNGSKLQKIAADHYAIASIFDRSKLPNTP
jgi:hypothetical protein